MKKLILLTLIICGILISCNDDENFNSPTEQQTEETENNNNIDLSDNFGAEISRNFIGEVLNENQVPIPGVNIHIGSSFATTDQNGIFIIKDASVFERFAYIQASKNGYINSSRVLIPNSDINEVTITLLEKNVTKRLSAGSPASVSLPDGTLVELDGNYEDKDGNDYSGDVNVVMHHLDPDENMHYQMPGMLYAANKGNEERILESFGMVLVELIAENGEQLNLAEGSTAILHVPLQEGFAANAPSNIPLWHFDEDKGYWIEEGEAILQGNEYVGTVSHFTFWGPATMANPVNLCLNIQDENNNPLNVTVFIAEESAPYNSPYYSKTHEDGQTCGLVSSGETLSLEIEFGQGDCASSISTSIGPYSNDSSETININLSQIGLTKETVTGQLLNCDNDPVTNGYVRYHDFDNHGIVSTENDGSFEFSFLKCNQGNATTLIGVDYENSKHTDVQNYNLTSPTTNLGTIITCNDSFSYIDLTYTMQIENYVISEEVLSETINIVASFGPSHIDESNGRPMLNILRNQNDDSDCNFLLLVGILDTSTYNGQNTNTYTGLYNYNKTILDENYTYNNAEGIHLLTCLYPYNDLEDLNNSIIFDVTNIGEIGEFIDINISGSFQQTNGIQHILEGEIHVLREN